jgi:hypothetical protein
LGTETAHRINRLAGVETSVEIPTGRTIRNIAAALLIETELPQTGLVVRHAEIRWPTVRLRPGTRLAGRAAIWPAIAPKELAEAIEPEMEPAMELVQAIGPQAQERTG